jgi:hypothetical protein
VTSTEWARRNPERWKEHQQRYRIKQRKPCRLCNKVLSFPSPGRKYCIECVKIVKKQDNIKRRQWIIQKRQEYKLKHGCSRCGYNKCAASLDFHHIDPKTKKHRVWLPYGEEFEKCVLICKNCHYEEHEYKRKKL